MSSEIKKVYKVVYNDMGRYVSISRCFNRHEKICEELMLEYELDVPVYPKKNVIFAFDTLKNAAHFAHDAGGVDFFFGHIDILESRAAVTTEGILVSSLFLVNLDTYIKGLIRSPKLTRKPKGTVHCLWLEPQKVVDKLKYTRQELGSARWILNV